MDNRLEVWNESLEEAAALAKKNRWQKLVNLYYKLPKSFLFRTFKIGRIESVKTFMDISLQLPFPESNDIFLFGAKVHDSEIRLTKFLLNYEHRLETFFDVGAHVGFYTTLVAERFPNVNVYAFEPSTIFKLLKRNTASFPNIQIEKLAVSDRSVAQPFYEFEMGKKEYNSLVLDESKGLKYSMNAVQGVTLDDYIEAHKIRPDLIKIDIEGGEYKAVKGIENLLIESKVTLVLEIIKNTKTDNYNNLIKYLNEREYLAYQIAEDGSLIRLTNMSEMKCESENIVFKPKSFEG